MFLRKMERCCSKICLEVKDNDKRRRRTGERLLTERLTERRLTWERRLTGERRLTERLTERLLTGERLTERRLTGERLTERLLTERRLTGDFLVGIYYYRIKNTFIKKLCHDQNGQVSTTWC
jgi:hypothetical protein